MKNFTISMALLLGASFFGNTQSALAEIRVPSAQQGLMAISALISSPGIQEDISKLDLEGYEVNRIEVIGVDLKIRMHSLYDRSKKCIYITRHGYDRGAAELGSCRR